MANDMKLTCVTAVFNAIESGNRERLIRCVESVAALKTEHEHLIYDGASTDGTVGLLRELEAKTPGLKVQSEPDSGIYNALNKGVRDAKGEWLYVLGCDDYVSRPTVMDRLIKDLDQNCDILAASVEIVSREDDTIGIFSPRMSEIYLLPCACHQGEIMRTAIARKLGGFDEQYKIAADSDLFLKAHFIGCNFRYVTDVIAVFTASGSSGVGPVAGVDHRTSVANVLGLIGREREMIVRDSILPYRVCLKLLTHQDVVIRHAAWAMIRHRFNLLFLNVIRPLIVITRPMRHKVREWRT